MSTPGPFGGGQFEDGNPFGPLFDELAKMFASQGPVNWQLAKHFASQLAGGGAEPNVDPLQRIAFEDLVRVADLHVAEATGLPTSARNGTPSVKVVTRSDWAARTLDDWRLLFEGMAGSLGRVAATPPDADEPTADLIGGLTQFIAPMLLGMQAGSMVGHLAQTALGQYHFPIPRPHDDLLIVAANVDALSDEAGLERNDVRMWVLVSELAHHAVITRPHVHRRLNELFTDYVALFQPELSGLEEKLGSIDPMNPSSFEEVLGDDPAALYSSLRSPAQELLMSQISAVVAAVEGYVDHIIDRVTQRLIGPNAKVADVVRQGRAEQHAADPIAQALFGLDLSTALFERGWRFVNGVRERVGDEGLARLWLSDNELPTPAEVDAPGLWWERINLPLDSDLPDFPDTFE